MLIWLDIETTGLDPDKDHLLEVAAVATHMEPNFKVLGCPFSEVIAFPEDLTLREIDNHVLKMHANNGLIAECVQSNLSSSAVSSRFYNWLYDAEHDYGNNDPNDPFVLAGRGVHFDRKWLQAKWTAVMNNMNFSHRLFDLTPIKSFVALCQDASFPEADSEHRALGDIMADIDLARKMVRHYRDLEGIL